MGDDTIAAFQERIAAIYGHKDRLRGLPWTFAWLVEEVGELGTALRQLDQDARTAGKYKAKFDTPEKVRENLAEEFADVLAWLSTLASMVGVELEAVAAARYGGGCPYCGATPCACASPDDERPVGDHR